ncbi:IS5 family transposase [Novosphingobium sp. fls2-241-R2A-195]|uniref:IS5 family transposase n=1 Tax=Novosphingobium sp. fls2-241-R2A-195 TaxID=3040296 RepID=UPI00254A0951|nr:IS5 family transposase [Novosphingobium sp. fls2-241-R2A-195]
MKYAACPWRDMHERYGLWNSIYVRFRRWAEQGVWDAILATLVELGLTDDWQHMIDSTTVRGHVSVVGGKKGGGARAQAFGRSRGGFTCKVHARCDNQGRPLGFILTSGEASDYDAVDALMAIPVIKPKALLADKGHDGDAVRENLLMQGILPIIPPKINRREPIPCYFRRYRDRNRIGRIFGHPKQFRHVATRYDKTALSFASFLNLAAIRKWLSTLSTRPRSTITERSLEIYLAASANQ